MNLLVVTQKPDSASFRQRIGLYLPLLRHRGCTSEVVELPARVRDRQRLFEQAQEFDAILLHRKVLTLWDGLCVKRSRTKVIYDFDDAVMYKDAWPCWQSPWRYGRFFMSVRAADLVIAGNAYLAEYARRYNPNVEILPTGLNVRDYFTPDRPAGDDLVRLVWIGSRSTLRYLKRIKPVLEELGRYCPNVVLRIICDEFFDLRNMRVEKRRWSSEGQVADLVTSDIGLAPLSDDRFTRGKCGFKVLQYAAAGLPVVASPVGVNAEYVRDGITGLHATDAADWLRALRSLIDDRERRLSMGHTARLDVQRFDLAVVAERLYEIITECVRTRGLEERALKVERRPSYRSFD